MVLDKAGQKGTGKWTAETALDLVVPAGTIAAAIEARVLSSMKDQRETASRLAGRPARRVFDGDRRQAVAAIRDALYASKVCSYAQGMSLIQAGSEAYNWKINLRRDGAHLEGRLHHSRRVPERNHAGLRARPADCEPVARLRVPHQDTASAARTGDGLCVWPSSTAYRCQP